MRAVRQSEGAGEGAQQGALAAAHPPDRQQMAAHPVQAHRHGLPAFTARHDLTERHDEVPRTLPGGRAEPVLDGHLELAGEAAQAQARAAVQMEAGSLGLHPRQRDRLFEPPDLRGRLAPGALRHLSADVLPQVRRGDHTVVAAVGLAGAQAVHHGGGEDRLPRRTGGIDGAVQRLLHGVGRGEDEDPAPRGQFLQLPADVRLRSRLDPVLGEQAGVAAVQEHHDRLGVAVGHALLDERRRDRGGRQP